MTGSPANQSGEARCHVTTANQSKEAYCQMPLFSQSEMPGYHLILSSQSEGARCHQTVCIQLKSEDFFAVRRNVKSQDLDSSSDDIQ
jgi:hypothetical protein